MACPCEDTPLAFDLTPLPRDEDVGIGTSDPPGSLAFIAGLLCETPWRTAKPGNRADHPSPQRDQSLRWIRTVVLMV